MSKGLEAFYNIKREFIEWTDGYEEDLNFIEIALKILELIKELVLDDLVFDDKEQEIKFSFGASNLCIKIKDKTKYDLLKEVLL